MDIESRLDALPDEVADAKAQWQKSTLLRELEEAKLYRVIKAENPDRTATEIKHLINEAKERYDAVMIEISFEQIYNSKYEILMALKTKAKLRTAF